MKLRIYGGPKDGGWSVHGEHQRGIDDPLLPCPFCGSDDIELSNTHTPYYSACCRDCDAQGPTPRTGDTWKKRMSKRATIALHHEAFKAAIAAWNNRKGMRP